MTGPDRVITVSALVIRHPDESAILMVRKRGTTSFILPGGKPEPGELPEEAVIREVGEELCVRVVPADIEPLGTWSTTAANESGAWVRGVVFVCRRIPVGLDVEAPQAAEEIAESGWFSTIDLPADTPDRQFAPLTRDFVIPALHRR